jgi:NAD(P)-dependent dehydrogenase (short-subunit alcohol dehydrogenase family)
MSRNRNLYSSIMSKNTTSVALVTGTSSGLGRAVAERLVELGWEVIGTVRGNGTELAFETVHCDVTDDDAVARLGQYVFERWGRLDALVNNAGISLTGPMEELDPKEVRSILDVNLVAPMALARACLPALRAASGVIIQISSVGGYSSSELFGAYQASKFGLEGASEALQEEVSGQNVRVVLIEPGAFRTEIAVKGIQAGAKGSTGLYESSWVEVDAWLQWHASAGPDPAECVAAIVGAATLRDAPFRIPVGEDICEELRRKGREMIAQADAAEAFLLSL